MRYFVGALITLAANSLSVSADGKTGIQLPSADVGLKLPGRWEYSSPLISAEDREAERSRAQKDPTIVFHEGRWHLFMTVKLPGRSAIEHCSFTTWKEAQDSKRTLLPVSDSDYFCAAQVFFFRPHNKWYLIYQMGVPDSKKMWVAYSTTSDIADPLSWTKACPILDGGAKDSRTVGGLDYWIICNKTKAYLFFTSLNGKMWRMETDVDSFPQGFRNCQVALSGPVFEASHTYKIKDKPRYLTIIEQKGRRHFKAYVANRLDGKWVPLADTEHRPFAGFHNVKPASGVSFWADNISHGELIRHSNDERLVIDPDNFQLLFQGMLEQDKKRKGYGEFNWRLGLLTPVP